MTFPRIAGRALAALALLTVVACGDDDTDDPAADTSTTSTTADTSERSVDEDALDQITDAVENTIAEGTASFVVTVETEGTGTGADGEQPIEAEGEVDFDEEMRRIVLVGPQGDLDVVVDDDVAYLELPATEGDDWMSIDLSDLFDESLGMGGPAGIPFQDPEDNLRLLEASALHAEEAGEESIDGTDTTRYELVIDIEAASEEADEDVQDAVDRTTERTDLRELEMEVWVDDDELIRRVAYNLDLAQAEVSETEEEGAVEADPQGTVTVTVDYSDFGTDLDIEVPDEENIVDLDEDAIRDAVSGGTDSGDSGTASSSTTTSPSDDDTSDDDSTDDNSSDDSGSDDTSDDDTTTSTTADG